MEGRIIVNGREYEAIPVKELFKVANPTDTVEDAIAKYRKKQSEIGHKTTSKIERNKKLRKALKKKNR